MAGNDSPRLVKILIRLARNWANTKNRFDRATKRLEFAKASAAKGGDASDLDRLDGEADARGEECDTHPFDGFVRLVSHETGFDQTALRDAALLEFNGQREMVTALNALDANGTTAALFAKLWDECPDVASRLFGDDAEQSELAKLLERAGTVFGLANELGRALQEEMQSRGPVVMIGDESPRQRHQEKINEFLAAVLELRKPMHNPPDGSAAVVDQLRKAGQLAKRLPDTNEADILGLFPDLNTVAHDGYEAVKVARGAARVDDPFAFLDDAPMSGTEKLATTSSGATSAGEAFRRAIENDPKMKASWEREKSQLQAMFKAMQVAMNSPEYREAKDAEKQKWQELADAVRANMEWAGNELEARHFPRPETIEDWEHLARIVGIPAERIRTGDLTPREIFDFALAWADRQKIKAKLAAGTPAETRSDQCAETDSQPPATQKKTKRSTVKGEGQIKLASALTKHHQYADGGCLNLTPIGNNELARLADVSESTASEFFNREFNGGKKGGHAKYQTVCGDATRLVVSLKALNKEFSPHHFLGSVPPGDDERDTE